MPLRGRGLRYSRARHAVEWTLHQLYRGNWPAHVVHRLGLQRPVRARIHRFATARWPRQAPPLRLAFASDLHAGPTTHPTLLDQAFAELAAAGPDVVVLGGDYVFLHAEYIAAIADRVAALHRQLGPRVPIFAVMGNHDLWADDAHIAGALGAAGARVLVNQRCVLAAPHDHVAMVGLDDPWTGQPPCRPLFGDDDRVRIVVVHAPEAMLHLDNGHPEPFELALCGHTHGGHVALPGEIPIVAPGPLSRRYAHGRFDLGGGRTLIVSRGVGATEVALRTFADPDIGVVDCGRDPAERHGTMLGDDRNR